MNTRRLWPKQLYGKTVSSCGVAALVLLSACSGSNSDEAAPISRPATSAAQLANDETTSLSFAQAVAAGVVEPPKPEVTAVEVTATEVTTIGESEAATESTPTATTDSAQAALPSGPQVTSIVDALSANTATEPTTTDQTTITEATTSAETPVIETAQSESEAAQSVTETTTAVPNVAAANSAVVQQFQSATTEGFAGELMADGSVRVTWQRDPKARGYNVYRQAQYIDTIFGEEWIQTDLYDESYYYEIQAFDFADNLYYIATGLTVDVTGTGRTNPEAKPTNEGLLDDYELVFSDEFNGGSLDSSKWNTQYLWGPDLIINSEEQYYVDINNEPDFGYNPFEFDGENLVIKSIRTPDSLRSKANDQPYLSGVITSYDAFKFTYGYVEARAQVPYGKGYWAAFWLLNAYYVDDKPEIDIMEHIGDDQDVVYHTYHYYDADDTLRSTKSEPTPGIDFTSDFHTYGVEWSPGTIVFYVDGVEQHRISDPKVSQQDMYIIANTAIGGWWPGSPDASTVFPGEYKIDYIRAYQKTTPLEDFPFFDFVTQVPFADETPGSSPNHRPPFELWPEGYPDRN